MLRKFSLSAIFILSAAVGLSGPDSLRLAYVMPAGTINAEWTAARDFLSGLPGICVSVVNPSRIASDQSSLSGFDVIWLHGTDTGLVHSAWSNPAFIAKLRMAVEDGRGLLLSNAAALLVTSLGWESEPAETITKEIRDEGYGRMAGYHAYRSHPVFKGLNNGAYVLKPHRDIRIPVTGYFGSRVPAVGKVVGADWDYIFLREEKKMVWEYEPQKGRVLAAGGYLLFDEGNINRAHLEIFLLNCIQYLSRHPSFNNIPVFHWTYGPGRVEPIAPEKMPGLMMPRPPRESWPAPDDRPSVIKPADDGYYQVSGMRMVLMGNEKGGIREVWSHPFMALRDFTTWIQPDGELLPLPLDSLSASVSIRPGYLNRIYQGNGYTISETIVAEPEGNAAVVHYVYEGDRKAELHITFSVPFRLMWPYSHKVPGLLRYGHPTGTGVLAVTDGSGDFACMAGSVQAGSRAEAGQAGAFIPDSLGRFTATATAEAKVSAHQQYTLQPGDHLDILITAGNNGLEELAGRFAEIAASPYQVELKRKKSLHGFFDEALVLESPDTLFNEAWKWLLAGVNSFYIETPGLGKSLVAGHNTTGTGWNGGHEVDGRPGYAWYFGRDAQWSAMALLHYGDFGKVREILSTFCRFQDLNGKIYHELTTTGFAHYDASDATPLFIVLAGRYLQHSGDTAFIRSIWPNILSAYAFCLSTDTDGDHLIENTNVGHGWVEGGPLFGSHTSLYLASCWNEALLQLSGMAEQLGEESFGRQCASEALRINDIINGDFYNAETRQYRQGKMADGSWHEMASVMPSVPGLFGHLKSDGLCSFLDLTAGNEYITEYGSRILSCLSPHYRPNGYHSGSVWPLFTGWHALSAWKGSRPEMAFSLTMGNMMIYRHWGYGYIEEVLHGAAYKPAGVCRHQCWSATMALQPLVEGMLGFTPEATRKRINLNPWFPPQWAHFAARNLKCGAALIHFSMEKTDTRIVYRFTSEAPYPNEIQFGPYLPAGTLVKKVIMNGSIVIPEVRTHAAYTQVQLGFTPTGRDIIEVEFKPGFAVIPQPRLPAPGDAPEGFRILSARYDNQGYHIETEGPAGTTAILEIAVPKTKKYKLEGATFIECRDRILKCRISFPDDEGQFVRKRVVCPN